MPVFIAAVIALLSMIPAFAACENIVFSTVDEMRAESIKSAFRKNPAALPLVLQARLSEENPRTDLCKVTFYQYLYRQQGVTDLIKTDVQASFSANSPAGIFAAITFKGSVKARAFTGHLHKTPPHDGKDDTIVYIFPAWGMKYHGKSCTYVKANCQMVYLSQDTKKGYAPCSLCNASFARLGSPVFCFTANGRVYHLADCKTVQRYYVEITKGKAEEKGYTPCSKCGGV